MAKLLVADLTPFQQRAVLIIDQVNGRNDALALMATYRDYNYRQANPDDGEEFTLEEIVPLPAKCVKCKRNFIGKDAIRAPRLEGCRCFYCGNKLAPHPGMPPVESAFDRRRRLERQAGETKQQRELFA